MVTTVIFDLGQTLFDWKGPDRTPPEIAAGIADLLGMTPAECDRMRTLTVQLWPDILARSGHPMQELDLVTSLREVFASAGAPVGDTAMRQLIRDEHTRWTPQRNTPPEVYDMLRALRADGIRIGICSNTIDTPENCALDLRTSGLDTLIDASLFSTEIGARKPNPAIYAEILRRLGNPDPATVLFVGDRMLEDVTTPRSLGMKSCLMTFFRNENPAARPRAASPADVVALVRSLNGPQRAIG